MTVRGHRVPPLYGRLSSSEHRFVTARLAADRVRKTRLQYFGRRGEAGVRGRARRAAAVLVRGEQRGVGAARAADDHSCEKRGAEEAGGVRAPAREARVLSERNLKLNELEIQKHRATRMMV